MIKLHVWLTLEDPPILAGELIVDDPDSRGALRGQFRYSQSFLNWQHSFSLDPVHLPLSPKIFDADRPRSGIHGVFEDSLPDDWGRRVLVRKHTIPRKDQRPPQLLSFLSGDGLGALSYSEDEQPPERKKLLGSNKLEDLLNQAGQFERGADAVSSELGLLFQAGSSPGGARPKALVQDGGVPYIAKFRSMKDQFDVVALEAAAMSLAGDAGIEAAPTRCIPCGSRKILLVERFDIHAQSERRCHRVSLQTLLGADSYYHLGYRDIANIVKKVSSDPAKDLQRLFKQLVFNVLIGNTDDHLKNFSMISDGGSWRLSPAYDLVPNIGRNKEHVLSVNNSYLVPGRDALVQEAKYFGIKQRQKANVLIDSVVSGVQGWEKIFLKFDVPHDDTEVIGRDIQQRLSLVSG
jgi:serine/threonine-protein kinase HipA